MSRAVEVVVRWRDDLRAWSSQPHAFAAGSLMVYLAAIAFFWFAPSLLPVSPTWVPSWLPAAQRSKSPTRPFPRVLDANPSDIIVIQGNVPSDVVRRVVHRNLKQVRYCYARVLRTKPTLQGRVVVQLIIASTGAVHDVSIATSDLHEPRVEACITRRAKTWRFPAPEGGGTAVVTYPFVLQRLGS